MKKYYLLSLLFTIALSASANKPEGEYTNDNDYLVFNGDNIKFNISGFSGLSTAQVGEGNFEVVDDFLIINTTDFSGLKSSYEEVDATRKDTCVVKVTDPDGYAVSSILIESKNKSGKTIERKVTSNDGSVLLSDLSKVSRISTSEMGYNNLLIDYHPSKDYKVTIVKNDIIENRTVVLKIENIDDTSISLFLLTDNLDTKSNLTKELDKLQKKAKKANMLPKPFIKQNAPFRR
ncbi:MAG: hypothetical protein ACOYEA_01825 [Fermentimonas sp.]|jgi:hypothetical protein